MQTQRARGEAGVTVTAAATARRSFEVCGVRCVRVSCSGWSVTASAIGRRAVAAMALVTVMGVADARMAMPGRTAASATRANTERPARSLVLRAVHALVATGIALGTVHVIVMKDGRAMIAACAARVWSGGNVRYRAMPRRAAT